MRKILLLIALGIITYACVSVPLTGRSQLALVSNAEIQPLVDTEYGKILSESMKVNETTEGKKILYVGQKMSLAVEKFLVSQGYGELVKDFKWEFNLLESGQVNAWCMPGGKVVFYTGIIPVTQDETGIAVVMGHEIAHAVASHTRERMSTGMIKSFGLELFSSALGKNPTLIRTILLQSVGVGSELGMLKFSRKHELEADEMGLIFMAMAGYDPRQAPVFWGRMAAFGGQSPPEFISTHPASENRMKKLNEQMPEALKYYKP